MPGTVTAHAQPVDIIYKTKWKTHTQDNCVWEVNQVTPSNPQKVIKQVWYIENKRLIDKQEFLKSLYIYTWI